MKGQLTIDKKLFKDMVKLREEFDSLVETIEIMNNKKLAKGIEISRKQAKKGKLKRLKSLDEIDEW